MTRFLKHFYDTICSKENSDYAALNFMVFLWNCHLFCVFELNFVLVRIFLGVENGIFIWKLTNKREQANSILEGYPERLHTAYFKRNYLKESS